MGEMVTWIVGDVHGCFRTFERMLERIDWGNGTESMLLAGDLVNKGPASLEMLRWAYQNRHRVDSVLGNHDLHLLARAAGIARQRKEDTLGAILSAPDMSELLSWLRTRPLLLRHGTTVLVHAGIWPGWSLAEAEELAAACSLMLADDCGLRELYELRRTRWHDRLAGAERLAAALALFTRLRLIGGDGRPLLKIMDHPDAAPSGSRPWFSETRLRDEGHDLVFGHWARLGLYRADGVTCLDGGCVYGGRLCALDLATGTIVEH